MARYQCASKGLQRSVDRTSERQVRHSPLGKWTRATLDQGEPLAAGSRYLFSGRDGKRPLSNTVFLTMLRWMKIASTAPGFRDWAAETTSFPRVVVEMALAHTVENKVEAAYRRGDLLDKRRELMGAWERYVEGRRQDGESDSKAEGINKRSETKQGGES